MKSAAAVVHRPRFEDDPRRGFESHLDYLMAVRGAAHARNREDIRDERLQATATRESIGAEMSFHVPPAFTPSSLRAAAH